MIKLQLPDSILINKITLEYQVRVSDTLKILSKDSVLVFQTKMQNSIVPRDLYFYTDTRYSITHGEKHWELIFTDVDNKPTEETDVAKKTGELPETDSSIISGKWTWMKKWGIPFVIAVIVILICFLLEKKCLKCLLNLFSKTAPDNNPVIPGPNSGEQVQNNDKNKKEDGDLVTLTETQLLENNPKEPVLPHLNKILNELQEIKTKLQEMLSLKEEARDCIASKPVTDKLQKTIKEEAYNGLIKEIKERDKLKKIYKKAEEECSDKENNYEILKRFFSIISSEVNAAKSESDIIDEAISKDNLSDVHKKKLCSKLIEEINKHLDEGHKIKDAQMSPTNFLGMVADKLKLQIPSDIQESQDRIRLEFLNTINKTLGSEITNLFDDNSLKEAVNAALVKRLNENVSGLDAKDMEVIVSKLKQYIELQNLLNKYKAERVEELPMKIEEIHDKEVLLSTSDEVNELLPEQEFNTLEKLVKKLLEVAKKMKDKSERISANLEEKIALIDNSYVSEGKDTFELINVYATFVKDKLQKLNDEVSRKSTDILNLQDKLATLMTETPAMIMRLRMGANKIKELNKPFMIARSRSKVSTCNELSSRLKGELERFSNNLINMNVADNVAPVSAREQIQHALEAAVNGSGSVVNTLCQYYAYSRLPFMTDAQSEFGIIFDRLKITRLFDAVNDLYVQFSINLDVPPLFVMGIREGDYEKRTGQAYSELDNLCPNSCNHVSKIDSESSLSDIIVDIVEIGYSIDGEVKRKTSVITF
ncbi:MAG: hypothetical protein LUC91_05770 [Prevotella sp.]|nr:hypothetical protein [Prevotella sp.]